MGYYGNIHLPVGLPEEVECTSLIAMSQICYRDIFG